VVVNQGRRDRLRDAAIEVLAAEGGRGLTHRAVDATAALPTGTAKNYYPTRQSLLLAAAERCAERYLELPRPQVTNRPALVAMTSALLTNAAGPGRQRLLAFRELQAEATRAPSLTAIVDRITAADFTAFTAAQQAAGLPVTPQRAAAFTLAVHGALPHLLTSGQRTLAAAGLDDPERFTRDLLDALYGHDPLDAA
jgi:DNA-binding transcriptional regulator YbjK